MKITFLGQANFLVETDEVKVLFDPLIYGVHHDGLYNLNPEREINLDLLDNLDLIVISHSHLDHFDIPSLSKLNNKIPVLIPADDLIHTSLLQLGFENIIVVCDFFEIEVGDIKLVATPAAAGACENGYLILHDNLTIWNLIDTVPSQNSITEVKKNYGEIFLAITPWQPLQEKAVNRSHVYDFPSKTYEKLVQNIIKIDAKHIMPGACGFKATEKYHYQNSIIFPVNLKRFISDLQGVSNYNVDNIFTLKPCSLLEIKNGKLNVLPILSEHCVRTENSEVNLNWNITSNYLVDESNNFSATLDVELLFEQVLIPFVDINPDLFYWNKLWNIKQNIKIYQGNNFQEYTLIFNGSSVDLIQGKFDECDSYVSISLKLLEDLALNKTSWDFAYFSGDYKYVSHAYRLTKYGVYDLNNVNVVEIIQGYFGQNIKLKEYFISEINSITKQL